MVVSDCGAISDFWEPGRHGVSPDAKSASAKAVRSGTDVECGSNYHSLPEAVKAGAITEDQIDVSVKRLLKARFELGDLDPDELVPWTKISEECDSKQRTQTVGSRHGTRIDDAVAEPKQYPATG
jgi:beta-glucosidase